MSGTDKAYNLTAEDVKKVQAQESARHGGNIPADSEAAGLQSIVSNAEKDKQQIIAERQANLPLPDQPSKPSDFNSMDARTVNVGSGGGAADVSQSDRVAVDREGAGRQAAEGLSGLPNDAVTSNKKNAAGVVDTTNKDYGYPQKSDPADTTKLP